MNCRHQENDPYRSKALDFASSYTKLDGNDSRGNIPHTYQNDLESIQDHFRRVNLTSNLTGHNVHENINGRTWNQAELQDPRQTENEPLNPLTNFGHDQSGATTNNFTQSGSNDGLEIAPSASGLGILEPRLPSQEGDISLHGEGSSRQYHEWGSMPPLSSATRGHPSNVQADIRNNPPENRIRQSRGLVETLDQSTYSPVGGQGCFTDAKIRVPKAARPC